MKGIVGSAWVCLFLLSACNSESTLVSGKAYFPLQTGDFRIYSVAETNIEQLTCGDGGQTLKDYQLKALITDSSKNTDGSFTYDIHRYTRPDSTQPWTDLDTWTARITSNQIIVTQGNVSYVKLPLMFFANEKWNGNLYNDQGEEDYTLKNLGQSYTLSTTTNYPGTKYPSSVTVVQSDNQDFFVYQDKRIEVYAAGIGLIYKETTQLTYFQDPCYGQQKVKNGLIYMQTLESYGHE
ncbi:MAG: hypothetical protein JST48_03040 [Bacteroidetes bacterium]|nr:hypothetical protein [Bacteroidota bacterium]